MNNKIGKRKIEKILFSVLLSILLIVGVFVTSLITQSDVIAMSAGDSICWTGVSCYHVGQKCNVSCDCNWIGICKYEYVK